MRAGYKVAAAVAALVLLVPARAAAPVPAAMPVPAAPTRAAAPARIDPVKLEGFVDGAVAQAMKDQHIAGMTVAVIDRNGPLLLKGYGIAGHGRTVDADTLFRVGSISKTITWIAIMQLVEQGRLGLDDPINAHLPKDLQIPDEGFSEPIRIRHLMTHTAGFEDSALGVNVQLDLQRLLTLDQYLKRYRVHRVRPPGQIVVYSNYGAALAGAIVAHETHMPFVDYAEKNILRPLGMQSASFREPYPEALTHSGFPVPLPKDVAAHASSGFRFRQGQFVEQTWDFLPMMAPAGALSASARDMAAYMAALLNPERFEAAHVLRAATVLAMREPTFRNDSRLGANRHGFWDVPVPSGELAFGHNGGMAFHLTSMTIMPESGLAIFAAQNTANLSLGETPAVTALPSRIIEEFLGRHVARRAAVAKGESESNAGCYRPLRRPTFRTEHALYSVGAVACFAAMPNGDLLFGTDRFVPIGHGAYATPDLWGRIAFGTRDGRKLLYNFDSSGPAERAGFFETPNWFNFSAALALAAALWRTLGLVGRAVLRRESLALLVADGVGVGWLAAICVTALAVAPWFADLTEALLNYPGKLFPIACWLLLAAALATLIALFAVLFLMRPKDWPWPRWLGFGVTYTIFVVFGVTLFQFGLLGFSGW